LVCRSFIQLYKAALADHNPNFECNPCAAAKNNRFTPICRGRSLIFFRLVFL
jgi:hypothetical protein